MAKTMVYNLPSVVNWASNVIGGAERFPEDSPCIGLLEDGKLVGAVVYTMYTGTGVMMSVASSNRRWLNRPFLRAAFSYPFKQLGCRRVSGLVRVDNKDAQRFDEHLGFKREGLLRSADYDGEDLIMYGMLKDECKWINI